MSRSRPWLSICTPHAAVSAGGSQQRACRRLIGGGHQHANTLQLRLLSCGIIRRRGCAQATTAQHADDQLRLCAAVPLEVTCRDWTAAHRNEPSGLSVLTVHGTCEFPTAGYSVELLRHEPQGINPLDLLLDRIVHPPTGPSAQVVTQIEAAYTEVTDVDYQSVTILPDGPSVPVEDLRPGEVGTADAPATPGAV
jgi:hypothetical protein